MAEKFNKENRIRKNISLPEQPQQHPISQTICVHSRNSRINILQTIFLLSNGVCPFNPRHAARLRPRTFSFAVHLQIDYAHELTAPPGPALVIAGAGSGKTRTLTYRVAYLLEQGIPAERILLLTFTNKAAGEMMRRVTDLLGHELRSLWGGTFHSIGARILRPHADRSAINEISRSSTATMRRI